MPWQPYFPYEYYEEPLRPVQIHTLWNYIDDLAKRVSVLEQKVQALEKTHESKGE